MIEAKAVTKSLQSERVSSIYIAVVGYLSILYKIA